MLLSVSALADTCPPISGLYELDLVGEKAKLGFKITNCEEITLTQDGLPDVVAKMNGEATDLGGEGSMSVTFDSKHVYVSIVTKPIEFLGAVLGEFTSAINTISLDTDKNLLIEAVYKNYKDEVTDRESVTAKRIY